MVRFSRLTVIDVTIRPKKESLSIGPATILDNWARQRLMYQYNYFTESILPARVQFLGSWVRKDFVVVSVNIPFQLLRREGSLRSMPKRKYTLQTVFFKLLEVIACLFIDCIMCLVILSPVPAVVSALAP